MTAKKPRPARPQRKHQSAASHPHDDPEGAAHRDACEAALARFAEMLPPLDSEGAELLDAWERASRALVDAISLSSRLRPDRANAMLDGFSAAMQLTALCQMGVLGSDAPSTGLLSQLREVRRPLSRVYAESKTVESARLLALVQLLDDAAPDAPVVSTTPLFLAYLYDVLGHHARCPDDLASTALDAIRGSKTGAARWEPLRRLAVAIGASDCTDAETFRVRWAQVAKRVRARRREP